MLPQSLFALSKAFFDKSKACSRCFQNLPFGLKQLKALIFHFAKIYLQKSALMTAQRDLGNNPLIRRYPLIVNGYWFTDYHLSVLYLIVDRYMKP